MKLCITVLSSEEVVDSEIGHQNGKESGNSIDVKVGRLTQLFNAFMQWDGVNHECNECPSLLGIPRPVTPHEMFPQMAPRNIPMPSMYVAGKSISLEKAVSCPMLWWLCRT